MKVLYSVEEIQLWRNQISNLKIGFVPTMGALHKGHLELVNECKAKTDICVVSIFVNPTQFNKKRDYQNYPRNINKDLSILRKLNIDYLFLSPLFPSKKNKRCLGIYRFLKLKNLTKKKMICLGGINSNNLKIINRLRCYGIASISFFKN